MVHFSEFREMEFWFRAGSGIIMVAGSQIISANSFVNSQAEQIFRLLPIF